MFDDICYIDDQLGIVIRQTHIPAYDFAFRLFFDCKSHPSQQRVLPAVVRIGAIADYLALQAQLYEYNLLLINSYQEHLRCSELPQWYPLIAEGKTPRSKWYDEIPTFRELTQDFPLPVFIKGARQTSRHRLDASIIRSQEDFERVVAIYREDPILHWQQFVCREYIPLRSVEGGLPGKISASFEFRTFWWQGEYVGAGRYWCDAAPYDWSPDEQAAALEVAAQAVHAIESPFIAVDVAQTIDGEWIIIECNDAQESGYAGVHPYSLWVNVLHAMKRNAEKAKALRLRQSRKDAEEINALQQECLSDPMEANTFYRLGMALIQQHRYAEAKDALQRAVELDPDDYEAFLSLARVLVELQEWDQSVMAFQHTIALEPHYSSAYAELGQLLEQQARYDEAIALYRQAAEFDYEFLIPLGALYQLLGRYQEATDTFCRAIDECADPRETYKILVSGTCADVYEHALETLALIQQTRSGWSHVDYALGFIYQGLGRYEESAQAFERYLNGQPHDNEIRLNLGIQSYYLQRYADAIAEIETAAGQGEIDQQALYFLALAYKTAGMHDKAVGVCRQLRSLDEGMANQLECEIGGKEGVE